MTFLVQCPHCGNKMKFLPIKKGNITKKSKKCVYCGKSFLIHPSQNNSRIIEVQ